jgi:hypothetical protein
VVVAEIGRDVWWSQLDKFKLDQVKLIIKLAKYDLTTIQIAHHVFNDVQCEKALWLALHGIPVRAIAHLLIMGSDAVKIGTRVTRKDFIPILSIVVQSCVPELAKGQEGDDADLLVERLLVRGDALFWSPVLLKQAVDYTFIKDVGDAKAQRTKNAREGRLAVRWSHEHDEGPAEKARSPNNKRAIGALDGMLRNASEQEIIEEHFGYRVDNHDVERVLMKKWLLKIRELCRMPDELDKIEDTIT